MTVKELIERLKECEPTAEVRYPLCMFTYEKIDFVCEEDDYGEPAVYISGEYVKEEKNGINSIND
jgi:hypothetical protein